MQLSCWVHHVNCSIGCNTWEPCIILQTNDFVIHLTQPFGTIGIRRGRSRNQYQSLASPCMICLHLNRNIQPVSNPHTLEYTSFSNCSLSFVSADSISAALSLGRCFLVTITRACSSEPSNLITRNVDCHLLFKKNSMNWCIYALKYKAPSHYSQLLSLRFIPNYFFNFEGFERFHRK